MKLYIADVHEGPSPQQLLLICLTYTHTHICRLLKNLWVLTNEESQYIITKVFLDQRTLFTIKKTRLRNDSSGRSDVII